MMRDLFSAHAEAALLKSLSGLERVDPALAARIRLPVSTGTIRLKSGVPHRLVGRGELSLTMTPQAVTEALQAVPEAGDLFIFGVGTGELIGEALKKFPERKVVAWSRDPLEWRLALARQNLQKAISSRRLVPALGVDLLRFLPTFQKGAVVEQSGAFRVWQEEHALLRNPPPKNASWILLYNGELFVQDLAAHFRNLGFGVFPRDPSVQSQEEMEHTYQFLHPVLVAAINQRDGLAEWAASKKIPALIWEIDPSLRPPTPTRAATTVHFHTYRRANIEVFCSAGYPHVFYSPLAAGLERCSPLTPEERPLFEAPVAFVGSSMLMAAPRWRQLLLENLGRWKGISEETGTRILDELMAIQRNQPRIWLLKGLIQQALPGFLEFCGPDDASIWLGELASAERRLRAVASLAPQGMEVWGDAGWERLVVHGVRYRGMATHQQQVSKVYAGARVNVDIGRLYQMDIVTMRVFDVLAAGGFLIAERSEALLALFGEGVHLEAWGDFLELQQKVSYYLAHPEEAQKIAAAGQALVRSQHTIGHRLDRMLKTLSVSPLPS